MLKLRFDWYIAINFCELYLFAYSQMMRFKGYVPVKSKLQHPPRAFEFLDNFCLNSPLSGPKSCSNAPTPARENYEITVFTFQTPLHATSHLFKDNEI